MRITKLHENPDTYLVNPAYAFHYMDECLKQGLPVVADKYVPNGYSYLINMEQLKKEYASITLPPEFKDE